MTIEWKQEGKQRYVSTDDERRFLVAMNSETGNWEAWVGSELRGARKTKSTAMKLCENVAAVEAKKETKLASADEPWVDNYPPLKAWLQKIGAQCAAQIPTGDGPFKSYIEMWGIRGGLSFMVLVKPFRHGWEIYTPCNSNAIAATLADAEARIGWKDPS